MGNSQFDTIIVGSGISGMAAGIILAGHGEKVLVVEQHTIPGGLTQTYTRKGSVFPTGVHRLGSLNPGQSLWYYFKYLDLMDRLELVPLSSEGFEHFFFPSGKYKIPVGHDAYQKQLKTYFPDETKAIKRYCKDFRKAISGIGMYDPCVTPEKNRMLEYSGSVDEYLNTLGISGHLKSLITGNNPLYGMPSFECPLIMHFTISDSYLNSGFRINEVKTPFSKALSDSFQARGGRIKLNAMVKQVCVKDKTAVGVILENGEQFGAEKVVFSGHPVYLPDICPPELFRPVYLKRLNRPNTPGICGVAMKWKNEVCPVKDHDVYIYDTWDVDYHYRRTSILGNDPLGMVYVSALPNAPLSAKQDGDVSATALTAINDIEYRKLAENYSDSNYSEYQRMKEKVTHKILDHLTIVFPDVINQVEIADCYTPATFQRYTLTPNGTGYGIKKTSRNFMAAMFSPATKIRNLFLTGQSIGYNGIHGSIVSSVRLCSLLLGDDQLFKKIAGTQN